MGKKALIKAHEKYLVYEPRDLFYRLAKGMMEDAWRNDSITIGQRSFSKEESLGVLLLTWNSSYYRFRPIGKPKAFSEKLLKKLEKLLKDKKDQINRLRSTNIMRFTEDDWYIFKTLYKDMQKLLDPVGASKALHLIAPHCFVLWDRHMAVERKLKKRNANEYRKFAEYIAQCMEELKVDQNNSDEIATHIKQIDEWNYVNISLPKIKQQKRKGKNKNALN